MKPEPARPHRAFQWLGSLLLALLSVALYRQAQRLDTLERLLAGQENSLAKLTETTAGMQATLDDQPQAGAVQTSHPSNRPDPSLPVSTRLAALESRVQQLGLQGSAQSRGPEVPEYDPALPELAPEAEPEPEPPKARSWSAWQVTGVPNTAVAGDAGTAWATRSQDNGPEWLQAGFGHEVEVAEVRVRESYNAGAISRITAAAGGGEITLWEGTATPTRRLRDFVVRPDAGIVAGTITIYLDTSRVSGWNEIDAVELVGRDGSRQWARSARASSSYGNDLATGAEALPTLRRLAVPAEPAP